MRERGQGFSDIGERRETICNRFNLQRTFDYNFLHV